MCYLLTEALFTFTDIFKKSIIRINPDFDEDQAERLLQDTSLLLDNEDLGKAFYEKLISNSGIKLIDFESFEKMMKSINVLILITSFLTWNKYLLCMKFNAREAKLYCHNLTNIRKEHVVLTIPALWYKQFLFTNVSTIQWS